MENELGLGIYRNKIYRFHSPQGGDSIIDLIPVEMSPVDWGGQTEYLLRAYTIRDDRPRAGVGQVVSLHSRNMCFKVEDVTYLYDEEVGAIYDE